MKLVYAVSQWTNSKRPAARHLDNGEEKPSAAAMDASLYYGRRKRVNQPARFARIL